MRTAAFKIALIVVPLAFVSGAAMSACAEKAPSKVANIKEGEMPTGARWDGVYFNPTFGYLHLVETNGALAGRWRTADGTRWGELNGDVKGNLVHFEWTEHKIGMVGASATSKGKGYFVYKRPPTDNPDDELKGEWGLVDSEVGNEWNSVKQRNQKPDLKSVKGDEESGGPGKDWK